MTSDTPVTVKSRADIWIGSLRDAVLSRTFVGIIAIMAVLALWVVVFSTIYDTRMSAVSTLLYSTALRHALILSGLFFIAWRAFYVMIVIRPRRLTLTIIKDLKENWLTPQRLMTGLPVMLVIPFFFSLFTSAKNMIPVIQPFAWDPVFADMDAFLHFGRQPWEWLHIVIGFPLATCIVGLVYKCWFVIKYGSVFWQAFSLSRPKLRTQFLWAFFASWIVNGTLLATLLSSAGPCYFGLAYPGLTDPFAPLMTYMQESDKILPVWHLFAMEYLWSKYEIKETGIFSGISAMPSMHVSVAFLLMLLGLRMNKWIAGFFIAFFVFTLVGSVHLGWHYAVDGYLAIITSWLLWWGAGKIAGRDDAAPVPKGGTA